MMTREKLWHMVGTPKPDNVATAVQWEKDDKKAHTTMGLFINENHYSFVKTVVAAMISGSIQNRIMKNS